MVNLLHLSDTSFENLVFDVVVRLGAQNVVWRTPGRDVGRDIEAEYFVDDLAGCHTSQRWYIECKRHEKALAWPVIWEKIAYAESHDADFLLVATTSSPSPQAIDAINDWNARKPRPLVRFWSGHQIVNLLQAFPDILVKFGLAANPEEKAALSLKELSVMLMKATQAGYNEAVFKEQDSPTLEAAAALSYMISRRMEQLSQSKTWWLETVVPDDVFPWAELSSLQGLVGFDRYAIRSLLAMYRLMRRAKSVSVAARVGEGLEIDCDGTRDLTLVQKQDLQRIGFWGDIEVSFRESAMIIYARKRDGG